MNKRRITQLLIFLTMLITLSFIAYAQPTGIPAMFGRIGKLIFKDFGAAGAYGFKFLLWIVLFTLFDYGLKKGAKFENKTASLIAFALALGSVIMIPGATVIAIFRLYSKMVIIALGIFVPLILFYVIHKNFSGDDVGSTLMKVITYFIVASALFWFVGNADTLLGLETLEEPDTAGGWVAAFTSTGSLIIFVGFIGTIFMIAGIVNIFKVFGGLFGGKEMKAAKEGAKAVKEAITGKGEEPPETPEDKAKQDAAANEAEQGAKQNVAADEKMDQQLDEIDKRIGKLETNIQKGDVQAQGTDQTINEFNRLMSAGDLNGAAALLQQAGANVAQEAQTADAIEDDAKNIKDAAAKVAAESVVGRKNERKGAKAEKKAGMPKAAKKSKQAGQAATSARSAGRKMKRSSKDAKKESKKAKNAAEKELKLIRKIIRQITDLQEGIGRLSVKEVNEEQKKIREGLVKLYGERQKFSVAKKNIKKAYNEILREKNIEDNILKVKKSLDIFKVKEIQEQKKNQVKKRGSKRK